MILQKNIIFIIIGVFAVIVLYLLIYVAYSRNTNRRKGDKVKLKGKEKRIYGEVNELIRHGKIKVAASVFESHGMHRDAIDILEKYKLIPEAAGVLLRMSNPNRAAVVYARNGHYESAANCYELARKFNEAAFCSKQCGNSQKAVDFFIKAKKYNEAAETYYEMGKYQEAALIFIDLGDGKKACESLIGMVGRENDLSTLKVSERELKVMSDYIISGASNTRFASILAKHEKLPYVIRELILKGNIKSATDLYYSADGDIAADLVAMDIFNESQSLLLAQLFINVSSHESAGIIFERIGLYEKAAESFEAGEKYVRSAYCYERAGKREKANLMTLSAAENNSSDSNSDSVSVKNDQNQNSDFNQFTLGPPTENKASSQSSAARADGERGSFSCEVNTALIPTAVNEVQVPPPPPPGQDSDPMLIKFKIDKEGSSLDQQEQGNISFSLVDIKEDVSLSSVVDPIVKEQISKHEFFAGLTGNQLASILSIIERIDCREGTSLVDFQQISDGLYILSEGVIDYYRLENGQARHIESIDGPEIFGELWLIASMCANIRIVAGSNPTVYLLSRDKLYEMMALDHSLSLTLYKKFTHRLVSRFLVPQQQQRLRKLAS